jgi:hypothetical protein
MRVRWIILILFTATTGYFFVWSTWYRVSDELVFKDNFDEVSISVIEMEELLRKFPDTNMINYFVDNEGFLYLNNARIASIKNAQDNPKVRRDMVFEKLSGDEIDRFFALLHHLRQNEITSCHKEKVFDNFLFGFKEHESLNDIMVVDQVADTTDAFFVDNFKILDRRGSLILVGTSIN